MQNMMTPQSRTEAELLDKSDPLAEARSQFKLPENVIYLVGHSLGPAPYSAIQKVEHAAAKEWANGLVGSWNTADWIDLAAQVGGQIAPLLKVEPGDVIVCDSVTVNLFKLTAAALRLADGQAQIIIESDEFPTDQYIAKGLAELAGVKINRVASGKGEDALKDGGVLIKSAVNFRTGRIVDMRAAERIAKSAGGFVIWDLSHATGVVDLDLSADDVSLAVGCTYKYLNGGPGAPAFIYARSDIAAQMKSPLPGWLGHKSPFAFDGDYLPADGAARFVAGTPGILSLSALSGALKVFEHFDMKSIAAKAQALSSLCLARAAALGLNTISPKRAEERGGHVSLLHEDGYAIVQALAARGIKSDFRTPDTIRFGFSPLFLRYVDVWETMDALADILATQAWNSPEFKTRLKVT